MLSKTLGCFKYSILLAENSSTGTLNSASSSSSSSPSSATANRRLLRHPPPELLPLDHNSKSLATAQIENPQITKLRVFYSRTRIEKQHVRI